MSWISRQLKTPSAKVATTPAPPTRQRRRPTVATGIEGAKSVKNLLQVVPKPERAAISENDDAIKTNVERALKADTAPKVDVASVNKGVVLLNGSVDTLGAHLKAIEVANKVGGVQRVSSNVVSEADTE